MTVLRKEQLTLGRRRRKATERSGGPRRREWWEGRGGVLVWGTHEDNTTRGGWHGRWLRGAERHSSGPHEWMTPCR